MKPVIVSHNIEYYAWLSLGTYFVSIWWMKPTASRWLICSIFGQNSRSGRAVKSGKFIKRQKRNTLAP
jgi:acyl-CoA thioesterase